MGNIRTPQRRKHDNFTSPSSSFSAPTRPFAPISSHSPEDLPAIPEHPKGFGHSIERMTIHRPEPEVTAENEAEHVAPVETTPPSTFQLSSDTEALAEQDQPMPTARGVAPLAASSRSALQRLSISAGAPVPPPPPINRRAETKRSGWSLERMAITREHLSPVQRYATSASRTPDPSPQAEVLQQKPVEPAPPKENTTGLPDHLKSGIESLSGLSLDDVHVHYNSSKPAEVDALAYTQGAEIHVGPGQEKHLAHEAWHVVQQKEGRVEPTLQAKGVAINDDVGLEKEADVMGERAVRSGPFIGVTEAIDTKVPHETIQLQEETKRNPEAIEAQKRAEELNPCLGFFDNIYTTIGVAILANGTVVVAVNEGGLSHKKPVIQAMKSGEIWGNGPDSGELKHAEMVLVEYAKAHGQEIKGIGTSKPYCSPDSKDCERMLLEEVGRPAMGRDLRYY